jgi:hypothetical protein
MDATNQPNDKKVLAAGLDHTVSAFGYPGCEN